MQFSNFDITKIIISNKKKVKVGKNTEISKKDIPV